MPNSASAFCCVRAPANVTGVIAPIRVNGVITVAWPISAIAMAAAAISTSNLRGELILMLVIAVGLAASSSMVRPRAIAVSRAASRTRPSPIDIDRNTLSVIVRFTKVVSRWRVFTGRSFGASVWLPKKWMTLKLWPSIISFL